MIKAYRVSIAVVCFLFLSLYLVLSFNCRLSSDDFYYLGLHNEFGAWGGMAHQYFKWSGRWAAHWIACALIGAYRNFWFLPLITLSTLTALIFSIRGILTDVISKYGYITKPDSLLISLAIVATFFFTSYGIGESWFWYIIIITYMWSIIAFIIILNMIFREGRLINYVMVVLAGCFIGGASESFAMIFITVLLLILGYRISPLKYSYSESVNKKLIFAIAIITISLAVSAFAPGTGVRNSLLPSVTISGKVFITAKAFIKYFVRYLPQKILCFLFLLSPIVFFGMMFRKNVNRKINYAYTLRILSVLYPAGLIILFIPTCFILGETGPDRALSIVSLYTVIIFGILFFLLGTLIENKPVTAILIVMNILTSVYIFFEMLEQKRIASSFSSAYDNRLIYLESMKNDSSVHIIGLQKLPDHGMLYHEEISADTAYFVNQHIRYGLGLKAAVVLKNTD